MSKVKFRKASNDRYQGGRGSMAYKCFNDKPSGGAVKDQIMSNIESAEELHKPIIRKFEKRKVESSFIDNIQVADLADIQLVSKFSK